jgi:hypothetical protein
LPAKERDFQAETIDEVEELLPGCVVIKNDPNYIQGIPDWIILFGPKWACLEFKRSDREKYRPNQEWWLAHLDSMSFAAMICPENKEAVLYALQRSLTTRRQTRLSQRQ